MKKLTVKVSDKVSLKLSQLGEEVGVDVIRCIFEGEEVGCLVINKTETKTDLSLFDIVHSISQNEGASFMFGCTTQKELLTTMRGMKKIYAEMESNPISHYSITLSSLEANEQTPILA